jgi:hypothetical protein
MAMAAGQSRVEEGQGTVGLAIYAAGVPAAEMACGVDPDTSVLERSNILSNWATDIGNKVSGGGGDKTGEAEDILGTIVGSGGQLFHLSAQACQSGGNACASF